MNLQVHFEYRFESTHEAILLWNFGEIILWKISRKTHGRFFFDEFVNMQVY
jgi:hypothetical protein